jgi:mRNA interferase RelE/StbE
MAKVEMTKKAARQYENLPLIVQNRLIGAIRRLAGWPNVAGVKALAGDLRGWYRLRIGDYRMRFFVRGDCIVIDKIAHRRNIYEN